MNVSHIQVEYQLKGFVNITGCKPVTNQPGASPLVIKIPIDNARLKAWNKKWKAFLRDIIVSPLQGERG